MSRSGISRRGFLAATAAAGLSGTLGGCVGSGGSVGETEDDDSGGSDPLTLQSSMSDPQDKAALEAVVAEYESQVTLNTVAIENFRAQLPTYLTSSDPPDLLTWYAGAVARDYAAEGLLLDVSELWEGDGACADFSDALRELSTADDGAQIFVPTKYYWWGVFYRKSAFQEWDVPIPETWDDFLALCERLQSDGVYPLTMGTGTTPWMTSSWFDYLNLRINGPDYHLALLGGEESFDSAEVRAVMDEYEKVLPFIDPRGRSYSWQEAVTPLVQNEAAMYLAGAYVTQSVPSDVLDDIGFFRFPVIDESLPLAEEAPTDGFFAASNTNDPTGAKEMMSYLAQPDSQQLFISKTAAGNLPTSPRVDTSDFPTLVQQGVTHLEESDSLTQFFNRDSSDELQTTADAALTRFIDDPGDVDAILSDWEQAAQQVFQA